MTTTKYKFANNFEIGAIQVTFEEIQKAYEALRALDGSDKEAFSTAIVEIEGLYRDIDEIIRNSKSCAEKAIQVELDRIRPDGGWQFLWDGRLVHGKAAEEQAAEEAERRYEDKKNRLRRPKPIYPV